MTLLERAEAVWMVAAAAKSLQSCLTLFDPIDGSQSGSPIPGILQARTLVWVAISFSNAWRWKVKVKSLSRVRLLATPWAAAYLAPPSMGFSRQEYWSGVPLLLKIKSCLLRGFLSCPSGSRDLCHVDAYVCILRGSKEPWSESPGCWAQKCHLPAMISVCQYPWDIYPQPRPELQICGSSCFQAWFCGSFLGNTTYRRAWKATHSPWGSQRVGLVWETNTHTHTHTHTNVVRHNFKSSECLTS